MVRLDVKKDENLRDCSVLAIRPRENEHKNETPKNKTQWKMNISKTEKENTE